MVTTNAVRFPFANLLALLLMAGLFTALYNVTARHYDPVPIPERKPIEFWPLIHPADPPPRRAPLDPPRRDPMPPIPGVDHGDVGPGPTVNVDKKFNPEPQTPTTSKIDGEVTPIVRINPEYPRSAKTRGIQGWVQVQFTVSAAGSVGDVAIVDADPKGVFDEAVIKAVLRWKYAPKIEDGHAVERRGLQVLLRFGLD